LAIKYLDAKRIRGSSTVGAVNTLGTAVNGSNAGATNSSETAIYGQTSVNFDGSNDRIDIDALGGVARTTGSFCFWLNPDTGGGYPLQISDANGNEYIKITSESTFVSTVQRDPAGANWEDNPGGTVAPHDKWTHIVLTQDGTTVKWYLDAVDQGTFTDNNDVNEWINAAMDKFTIGAGWHYSRSQFEDFFNGQIQDVGFWNRALTSAEVTVLFNGFDKDSATSSSNTGKVVTDISQTGLLAYYTFNNVSAGITNSATVTDEKAALIASPTLLQENTIFEQTDNQGVFWLQSDAWVYGGTYQAIFSGGAGITGEETANNLTSISSDVPGGSWTTAATLPDSIWNLGSGMGDDGISTFMVWGGHNNTSGDNGELNTSYKFDGTTWGSSITTPVKHNGCANGGGSSGGALAAGGRDASVSYLISEVSKFNGTSWADAGDLDKETMNMGGDGDNSDYLRVAGTGSNGGQNPTFDTATVQSYNGSSWSSSPTNLGTAIAYNRYFGNTSGGICVGGAYNYTLTDDVQTYNGSSWTTVADLVFATRHVCGGSNNTLASTNSIIWGGSGDGVGNEGTARSFIWNGTTWTEKNALPYVTISGASGVKGL